MLQRYVRYTEPEIAKSALVTIDMQQDFSLPGAPLEIPGTVEIIPAMEQLVKAFRQAGLTVIHVVRLYLPDGSNADLCRRERIESGEGILEPGTDGAELVTGLKPAPDRKLDAALLLSGAAQRWEENEFVIYKPRWGAFYQTPLHDLLQRFEVTTLVICGCNFPNCPRTTIYEASERDYRIVVVQDGLSGIYQRGKKELENIGVRLWSTAHALEQLRSGR